MKNILLIVLAAFLLNLTSCQITEKIYLNDDGSGTFNLEIDMSEMMKSLSEMGNKKIDSTAIAKDSIIDFSKLLLDKKDSIATLSKEKQDELAQLKGMKLRIREDKANSVLIMNYLIDFKNVTELAEAQNMMSKAQSLSEGKEKKIPSKTNMEFYFKRNKFKRKSIAKKLSENDVTEYDKSMKSVDMFMEGSTYNLEYHFPRAIKKTTAKNATFSEDRKIMYLKSDMQELTKNPTILDFEVKLKR